MWLIGMVVCAPVGLAAPYVELGPSDGLALDQPRVAVEVFDTSGPEPESLGPEFFNTFLLDTGASGLLAVGGAVGELNNGGYETEAVYDEQGVAGTTPMNVSMTYRVDFAGTDGIRRTLDEVRMLSNSALQFGSFSGIIGMPAMVDRVTTMDMTVWSDLSDLLMGVDFSSGMPAAAGARFEVPLTLFEFPLSGQRNPDDPLPTSSPLPFAPISARHGTMQEDRTFIVDTGAQISILASEVAFALGLDADGNGSFDEEKLFDLPVGGIGGEIDVPVLEFDSLALNTAEGVDLIWTDVAAAVIDIDPTIAGIIGMDLLTSGWFEKFVGLSQDDGYIEQIHFDFRDAGNLAGSMFLDVNPALDFVRFEGDMNRDGTVNAEDYTIWANDYGQTGSGLSGDANGNGIVDAEDYTVWANDFGGESGPFGSTAASIVPEPCSAVLLLLGVLLAAGVGRSGQRFRGSKAIHD